jgi:hypothetical protein
MPEARPNPWQFSEQEIGPVRDRGQFQESKGTPPSRVYSANTASAVAATTYLHNRGSMTLLRIIESQTARESEMAGPTREEITHQVAASEAKTETKIARIEGKLDLVLSKLDAAANDIGAKFASVGERLTEVRNDVRADYAATRTNLWVVFVGILALIVALALLFPTFFDMGSKIRDLVDREIHGSPPSTQQ